MHEEFKLRVDLWYAASAAATDTLLLVRLRVLLITRQQQRHGYIHNMLIAELLASRWSGNLLTKCNLDDSSL